MIALDLTLIFQIVGFFVLLVILNKFLYGPVLNILKEREEKIDGTLKKASEIEKEVENGLVNYDKRIKEAAVKGHEERGKLRQEALDREKAILEAARADASKELTSMRKELEKNKSSALSSLKEEAKNLSKDIAEKVLERKIVVMLLTLGLTLVPAYGFAAEGEHAGSPTWKIINFIILAAGVYLVWTKAIKGLLEKRGEDIKKALDEARLAKEEADKKADEYRQKLNILDKRVSEIHEELRLEGEAEKKRMIAEAETASVRVKEQAKLAAEQEIKKARLELRKEVAELAVGMAQEILKKELSPADQERLVKGYLNNLRLN